MNRIGTQYGAIAGVVVVLYTLVFYAIDKKLMLSGLVSYGSLIFYIAAQYLAIARYKKESGGKLDFREGLRLGFLTYLIANAVFYVFYYFLHQYDASLAAIQKATMLENLPRFVPEEGMAQARQEVETYDFTFGLSELFFGYARGAIAGFSLAAGIAYMLKTPVEPPISNPQA